MSHKVADASCTQGAAKIQDHGVRLSAESGEHSHMNKSSSENWKLKPSSDKWRAYRSKELPGSRGL